MVTQRLTRFIVLAILPAAVASFSLAPSRVVVPATNLVGYRSTALASDSTSDSSVPDPPSQDEVEDWFDDTQESLQENVNSGLKTIDKNVLQRTIRIGNHVPTLISLLYFTLMSMASNMPGISLSPTAAALTRRLGPVTSAEFSALFPTKVTPAKYIFYAWPLIGMVQLLTVGSSALRPGRALLSQGDLTCLSMANVGAAAWLVVSSRTLETASPLGAFLILPLIPLIVGFPLRNMRRTPVKTNWRNAIYQLYSSFTTIASFLALTVELQYGGRIPFLGGRGELCSAVFLSLYAFLVRCPGQSIIKRYVNAIAMGGIVFKRLMEGLTVKNLLSVSFFGSCGVLFLALKKLPKEEEDDSDGWSGDLDYIKDRLNEIKESFTPSEDDD